MKPRLKNVTAEDVLNCLYYFHVDTPSDIFLMGDMQVSETSELIPKQSTTSITRKPLREGSVPEVSTVLSQLPERDQKAETTLSRAPSGALRFQTVSKPFLPRRPLPEVLNEKPPLPQRPSPDVHNIPQKRPLGPRPYLSQPEIEMRPLPGNENIPIRSDMEQSTLVADVFINDPRAQEYNSSESMNDVKTAGNSSFCSRVDQATNEKSFSITLIRRDPTSGAQWNIGKISNQSILENQRLLSAASSMPNRPYSSISVQLTTLGYGQFRAPSVTQNIGDGGTNGIQSQGPQDTQYSFDRQVRMVWSKSWERKYKQHGRASSDQTGAWKAAGMRGSYDIPSGQSRSEDRESGGIDLIEHAVHGSGFLSPWNGRCEFSTNTSGRSLKCKHTLNHPATISNLTASFSGVSVDVSELRFNLPSSSATDVSKSILPQRRPASSYTSKYPSNDNNALPRPPATSYAALYPSDNDDEDDQPDDVLDLSLGREKAGGGIRGKRAKLGKLIVHDEGLKMLDLVVAANMGIWWTVWERLFI
jgi:hypothetical protein